ncbi:hypothetical protein Goari_020953 [Gossypium aridum]|uniref:Glycosyl transferase 48 domain-containing protein n=1 Tax=Gossypium aridum TaxID=34290 RepID=A0A7J8YDE6_GOSAI|nr:hypothetical protein [Gossypium aridum]
MFITVSMWFLVGSWLFAPFVFNPSGFDWQKTVDDWTDWKRWMGNRGGLRTFLASYANGAAGVKVMTVLFVVCGLTISDLFAAILAFLPTGWAILLIGQAMRPVLKSLKFWDSIKELARGYEYTMGLVLFMPTAILSWFPFVSEFQTRLLFNQAFSRGLQISMILAGRKEKDITSPVKYA